MLGTFTRRFKKRQRQALDSQLEIGSKSLLQEKWQKRAANKSNTQYALGSMQEVDEDYTRKSSGNNPHVHLLLTTRAVGPDGFKLKMREADGLAFVTQAREGWAKIANAALGKAGADVQIDARSHAVRGIDLKPTKHRGPDPAERRSRRWGKIMDHDTLEARRELLGESHTRARFPLLSARPDWPPEQRAAVPGLTPGEALEWKTFWREIDKRVWGPELYPPRDGDDDRIHIESREPVQLGNVTKKLIEEVNRDAAAREARLEETLPTWRDLHEAVRERMRADGLTTDHPLDDWQRVESALRAHDDELTRLRQQEAERSALEPDPDGRPISAREMEEAQDRMLVETRQSPSRVAKTPQPELMNADERAAAQAAVERQNALEVPERDADAYRLAPHESRLDWLSNASGTKHTHAPEHIDRLDWIGDRSADQSRSDDRDRNR